MVGFLFPTLKNGMMIEVVTCNSAYFILKESAEVTRILGGTRKDGTARYADWTRVRISGSTYGHGLRVDYLGKNMLMEFFDLQRERVIITSPIRTITFIYEQGCYAI